MKAKIGDSVKIIVNTSFHKFKIGEIVKIIDIGKCADDFDYYVQSVTRDCYWVIGEDEFELIENKNISSDFIAPKLPMGFEIKIHPSEFQPKGIAILFINPKDAEIFNKLKDGN